MCAGGTFSSSNALTACTTCASGSYSVANATACTSCTAGSYSTATGNTTACTSCSAGSFSFAGQSNCSKWQSCGDVTLNYMVTEGTSTTDRVCAPYDLNPQFDSTSYSVTVAQSLAVGTPIQQLHATSSQGQQISQYTAFGIPTFLTLNNATGALSLSSAIPLSPLDNYLFTVRATDNRTSCFLYNNPRLPQPCISSFVTVTVSMVYFVGFPANQRVYLSDGNPSTIVTWTSPTLSSVGQLQGVTFTSNFNPGVLFAQGSYQV